MILIIRHKDTETKQIVRKLVDSQDIAHVSEDVLHEIEGYDKNENPIFKKDGEVTFMTSIILRNGYVFRVEDPQFVLLKEITDAKCQPDYDDAVAAVKEIDMDDPPSYDMEEDDDD